eukprot:TRINITY_DN24202_c0_g1_i1.p1 TRINITY_DN24202_c0_g1~~TRINITY_DN24202_c0_g1_i1.p1  ORF type:complete len:197 (+),score=11.19 TRINITY_DN24202_c0_g1_i1:54-644(+)
MGGWFSTQQRSGGSYKVIERTAIGVPENAEKWGIVGHGGEHDRVAVEALGRSGVGGMVPCEPGLLTTDEENIKLPAVMFLLAHGYYVLDGVKYGGDYMAYPAHPSGSHSTYLTITPPPGALPPTTIAAYIRQAQSLRKSLLLITTHETMRQEKIPKFPFADEGPRLEIHKALERVLKEKGRRLEVVAVAYERGLKG